MYCRVCLDLERPRMSEREALRVVGSGLKSSQAQQYQQYQRYTLLPYRWYANSTLLYHSPGR